MKQNYFDDTAVILYFKAFHSTEDCRHYLKTVCICSFADPTQCYDDILDESF